MSISESIEVRNNKYHTIWNLNTVRIQFDNNIFLGGAFNKKLKVKKKYVKSFKNFTKKNCAYGISKIPVHKFTN